jgi:hypothetical protein
MAGAALLVMRTAKALGLTRVAAPATLLVATIALGSSAYGATNKPAARPQPPAPASPGSPAGGAIAPAAERVIASEGGAPDAKRAKGAARGREGSAGEPAIRGPKLPEALRRRLQARLDARVDSDLAQAKKLRA